MSKNKRPMLYPRQANVKITEAVFQDKYELSIIDATFNDDIRELLSKYIQRRLQIVKAARSKIQKFEEELLEVTLSKGA